MTAPPLWLTESAQLLELAWASLTRETTVIRPPAPSAGPVPPPPAAATSTARSR